MDSHHTFTVRPHYYAPLPPHISAYTSHAYSAKVLAQVFLSREYVPSTFGYKTSMLKPVKTVIATSQYNNYICVIS